MQCFPNTIFFFFLPEPHMGHSELRVTMLFQAAQGKQGQVQPESRPTLPPLSCVALGKLLYLSEPFSISQTRLQVSTSKVGTKGGKTCEQVARNLAHKQGSPLHPFLFLALSKPLATQEMCSSVTQRPLLGTI